GPGAGVDPRTPQIHNLTYGNLPTVFFPVTGCDLGQRLAVDLVTGRHRHLDRREGPQGDRALAALEDGPLADDGAGTELVDLLAVELGGQHAVEEQEELFALLPLLHERPALFDLADFRLLPAAHDRAAELSFEGGLDGGHEGGGVLVTP